MSVLDKEFQTDAAPKSAVWIALKWAIVGTLISVAMNLAMNLFDINMFAGIGKMISYLGYFVFIGMVIFSIKDDRDTNLGGYISFGRAVGTGSLTGFFTGIFSGIWMYVLFTYLSPEMLEVVMEQSREQLLAQGQSEEAVEKSMAMVSGFMSPLFFGISTLISMPIIYLLISLIAASFLKKERPLL